MSEYGFYPPQLIKTKNDQPIYSKGKITITKIEPDRFPVIQKIIKLFADIESKAKHKPLNHEDWKELEETLEWEMKQNLKFIIKNREERKENV